MFCHYTGIEGNGYRTLLDGQKVEFEIEQTEKGPKAVQVRKIEEA